MKIQHSTSKALHFTTKRVPEKLAQKNDLLGIERSRLTRTWFGRHIGAVAFGLIFAAVLLLIISGLEYKLIPATLLTTQKDAIASTNSIVTTIILIVGAIFSYYKFVKGRLFALRADPSLSISVHPAQMDTLLHAITLTVKNIGSSTIWSPTAAITINFHSSQERKPEEITKWLLPKALQDLSNTISMIEANETISFFATREIPKDVWAVTYVACVSADPGDTWFAAHTVTNSVSSKDTSELKA